MERLQGFREYLENNHNQGSLDLRLIEGLADVYFPDSDDIVRFKGIENAMLQRICHNPILGELYQKWYKDSNQPRDKYSTEKTEISANQINTGVALLLNSLSREKKIDYSYLSVMRSEKIQQGLNSGMDFKSASEKARVIVFEHLVEYHPDLASRVMNQFGGGN